MTPEDQRRHYKQSLPQAMLSHRHTAACRVLPTREIMLDHMPKGATVAEIGVAFGDFSAEILARCSVETLYLIDLWEGERYQKGLQAVMAKFGDALFSGNLKIKRGLSTDALARFPDATFDWVYIDTDHSYHTTAAELALCRTKVKPGGLIAGHDFCTGNVVAPVPYGVIEAVNEFCIDHDWRYVFLTLETGGHFSFCLEAIPRE